MVVPESSINNIMGGLESTGGVTLHNHRRKLKQRFETIAKLGQGTYGKVQLGINKETGQEVAIKTIKKCKIETEADLIRIRREIQIMSSLRHPYIIHIYEVFENRDKMVLVMEYAAGGELYDYLSKKKVLDEHEARRIFRQIAMAVYYCHKHQICHRDLKLENILLDEQGNAKIADFGLSNVFDKSRLLSTFCGSPLYASPEIVKGIPYNGPEVDCWSLGVLLYTLVYGAMPFDGSNFKRLVRQISAGEYFEPKSPSTASELIAGLLTVKGSERLDIGGVCQHPWMAEEGKVSCYRLAVELAEQEPNRLDLLLALAPQENQIPNVPEEVPAQPTSERPSRSMSLSSLPTVQPSFTAPIPTTQPSTPAKAKESKPEKQPEKEGSSEKEKKRERSSSRTRKKESDEDKPRRKSIKTKKKSDPELSKEEIEKVLEEAKKLSEIIAQAPVAETSLSKEEPTLPEAKPSELPKAEEPPASVPEAKALEPKEEPKEKPKEVKKVKKVKSEKKEEDQKEVTSPVRPSLKKEKEVDIPDKEVEVPQPVVAEGQVESRVEPKETLLTPTEPEQQQTVPKTSDFREPSESKEVPSPFRRDSIRRKSKVFETAEIFNKSPTQEKIPQKKVFLPGVKVSDAKAAFERRSSVSQEAKPDVSLASTINVNKLVQNELNKDDEKIKKENAVKVISHAISESGMSKASTLPRRKLSKPSMIPRPEPERIVPNTSVSQVITSTPAPPPRPSLAKQESGPKEHIIPIQIEKRDKDDKPPPVSKQASISSRTSSVSSIGRQDSDSSTTTIGTPTLSASAEPIRKSPREVIIPIAVEGGGYITPSASTLSKMSSLSEGEDEERSMPLRGFGLHSTRRRVEATDSLSSDEEDDNLEMLTAENLFSSLLSRVRNLTYRLNENEGRPALPRLFNHSIFDSPSSRRRLTETKSFSEQDPTPWRRKRENASSSTLPRGFTARSFRRTLTGGDENRREGRPPPAVSSSNSLRSRRRSEDEVVEDFLATGKLSSLDRVRNYLEGIRRTNIEVAPSPLRRYLSSEPTRTDYPPMPRNRLTSFDGSARNNRHNFMSDERTLFDGQKKTSQTLTNISASAQNIDIESTKNSPLCNGVSDSKNSTRMREMDENVQNIFKKSREVLKTPEKGIQKSEKMNTTPLNLGEQEKLLAMPEKMEKVSRRSERANKSTSKQDIVESVLNEVQIGQEKIERTKKKVESTEKISKNSKVVDSTLKSQSQYNSSPGVSNNTNGHMKSTEKIDRGRINADLETMAESTKSEPFVACSNVEVLENAEKSKNDLQLVEKRKKETKNGSRVNKAINSLRKKSEVFENQFSESKLLKRAVSLEDLRTDNVARSTRASSLKPEGTFEKKKSPKTKPSGLFDSLSRKKEDREARIANLKRLDLVKNAMDISAESTPTGDQDEQESMMSATDNSDTWSSCDLGERLFDPHTEECVLERIRRKSFYHRFNMPKRQAYNRSMSNLERKRYY